MCDWAPERETLDRLGCPYTFVHNKDTGLKKHFGDDEHSYGHWINLTVPTGWYELWHFLECCPNAAHPRKKDLAPLRLISWLSCKLRPGADALIQEVMQEFAQLDPVQSNRILRIGEFHLQLPEGSLTTWDTMRDAIIQELTVHGLPNPPAIVVQLMTLFLQRLPLPRLVHFIDLVLPQMVPAASPSQRTCEDAKCSLLLRDHHLQAAGNMDRITPQIGVGKLFESHAGIVHVDICVGETPFLLFGHAEDLQLPPVMEFQKEKSVRTAKQNVVLGLKKGFTILLHLQVEGVACQAVLYLMKSVPNSKRGVQQHKLWKHVVPKSLEFAWLPLDLATTFCESALAKDAARQYVLPQEIVPTRTRQAWVTVDQIYLIGDCKSAHELEVFINMPLERLRVGCGLQCELPLHPIGPSSRHKLYDAAVQLLRFTLTCQEHAGHTEAEIALGKALQNVLSKNDEHVLAAISALVLALIEGRTDLPISGVFGAGKTRAAAIMVAGLLVFDPTLRILILTKENIAAKAFADHVTSVGLPPYLNERIGRLVGYMELRKNTANKTPLDIPAEHRIEALRDKQILIGCGGGYQQECGQAFSPVTKWIESVDLALTDESQQYGNLEETATVARTPSTCLHVWTGDHRQTPGGLKKTEESYRFRQKLQTRPLALRCGTKYVQPHELKDVLLPYLDGPVGSPSHSFKEVLQQTAVDKDTEHWQTLLQLWKQVCNNNCPWLDTPVCIGAFAILWMACRGEGISDPTATTFRAAAGLADRQCWGLILSTSARVTQLTYETVIGVRYPELVKLNNGVWQFGRFTPGEALLKGGFLPILWDVPRSSARAVEEIGSMVEWIEDNHVANTKMGHEIAVLHNQNHMVNQFGMSAWVAQSNQRVYSRSVTSCAGMTAYLVVVAQTRIGFLSGGRGDKFLNLPPEEQTAQIEDAFARATVALTRAQSRTVLFGPLDMKGLMGAATVVGSLACGVGHCWQGRIQMHWRKGCVEKCPKDTDVLSDLKAQPASVTGHFPPLALLECLFDSQDQTWKIRRLHLIIVDLWRPWKINKSQVRSITHCLRFLQARTDNKVTTPMEHTGGTPLLHERRFAYGYGLDGSDFPCYLVWPERMRQSHAIALLDSQSKGWVDLSTVDYFCPLDLHHLFDAFRISAAVSSADLKAAAIHRMGLREDEVSNDLQVTREGARRKGWPVHEEQPVDLHAREADVRNVPTDVISVNESEVDSASTSQGSSSDEETSSTSSYSSSSTDEPARSEVSLDHEKMSQAYEMTRETFRVRRSALDGGKDTLNQIEIYPVQWPLARLRINMNGFVQRLERLVLGYVGEVAATQWYPNTFNKALKTTLKLLTERSAIYIAQEIASLLRPVASHPTMKQFDPETIPLLSSEFWVMHIYKEMLYSGTRVATDRAAELKRPAPSLVKIVCQTESGDNEETGDKTAPERAGFREVFGTSNPMEYIIVWFPAHWAPVVMEALQTKNEAYRQSRSRTDDTATQASVEEPTNRDLKFTLGAMDKVERTMPTLTGRVKVDWLDLPVDEVLALFPTLQSGILNGVFRQKTAAAWFRTRASKAQVTVLTPGPLDLDDWLDTLGTISHAWPQPHVLRALEVTKVSGVSFRAARKNARAKHMWQGLKPDWPRIMHNLYMTEPGSLNPSQLFRKFFANVGQPEMTHDVTFKGRAPSQAWATLRWNQAVLNGNKLKGNRGDLGAKRLT